MIKGIKKAVFVIILFLLLLSGTRAPVSADNIRYNALENNSSFPALVNSYENILNGQSSDNIEEKLQDITEKQNFSIKKIEDAIKILKKQSGVKTFLVGNNLGILRFQLIQIKDQISELDDLSQEAESSSLKTKIGNQVKMLQKEQAKVEDFIKEQEHKFSLFGWFVGII